MIPKSRFFILYSVFVYIDRCTLKKNTRLCWKSDAPREAKDGDVIRSRRRMDIRERASRSLQLWYQSTAKMSSYTSRASSIADRAKVYHRISSASLSSTLHVIMVHVDVYIIKRYVYLRHALCFVDYEVEVLRLA